MASVFHVFSTRGEFRGSLFNGFLALVMGSIVIAFHNVWSGVSSALTLYGWALVVKGGLFLVLPSLGLKSLEKGIAMDTKKWRVPRVFLLAIGLVTLFSGTES